MAHVRPHSICGVGGTKPIKEKTMTGTAKGVFVISFMVALWAAGAAMAGTIEGIVKDGKTGNPLAGAAVRVVNSTLGAVTDLDGKYSIPNVNPGIYSLR